MAKYEYKFVKLSVGVLHDPDYIAVIQEHAQQGWRLNQIFTHFGVWWNVAPSHFELIFEREVKASE